MSKNKTIHREAQGANAIFNQRSLDKDYASLQSLLKPGMRVLDIGCGTGAITKDVAQAVGPEGYVLGIDNTLAFIDEGQRLYGDIPNLQLQHRDILDFEIAEKFDLIISARTFQWLSTVTEALEKIKTLLKTGGQVSILDYNHETIQWTPAIPASMQAFYGAFLTWRKQAGMNNRIGDDMAALLRKQGFQAVQTQAADEHYSIEETGHREKIRIWAQVARSSQTSDEGFITEETRLQAIDDYNQWVDTEAQTMTMMLQETRAKLG